MQPSPDGAESPLQQQVAELTQDLREAQRMAALGELVSTTTHEFNNLLTTILNYAKMGLRHADDQTRTRALEKILSAGLRAEKITNGVLGIARNRSASAAPTDLRALVSETLVLLERELHKYRIQVETRFETGRRAHVVGAQIQQVLINLLTNARQAMTRGGRIVIRVHEDAAAGTVDLTVRDNGPGVAPEHLPKLFQRRFTTKSGPDATGKGGAGMGLAACREIIESHGGRVRVESAVGQGAAFIIKLPPAPEAAGAPAPVTQLGVPDAGAQAAG